MTRRTDNLNGAAVLDRITDLGVADALLFHELLEFKLVLVAHLDDHTGILGKESLDHVGLISLFVGYSHEVMQVDVHAAFRVGEAHFQKRHDESAGRDVVTGHDPSAVNHFLNRHEGICKIFRILYRWHVVTHLAQRLCEG